jgi:hypothetical protein
VGKNHQSAEAPPSVPVEKLDFLYQEPQEHPADDDYKDLDDDA